MKCVDSVESDQIAIECDCYDVERNMYMVFVTLLAILNTYITL